ncbi:trigger factor [Oscillatoriales cyanobacterium USR001]|nr:trigger factor [Oscillatoriales cyanobacterium USR001]
MKVTQEKLPASQIGLEIEIAPEKSKQVYEQVVRQLSSTVNIPGFRKGKVPRHILLQRLGHARLKATALEDLINECLQLAIEQEKIEAIGNFELRSEFDELLKEFEPGVPLTFLAAVDVEPEVKIGVYTGLELKAEEVEYDPNQVDELLEMYRKDKATLIPAEGRSAQLGDVALVDFQGRFAITSEGEEATEIPGTNAEDFEVELQEDQFIPGFIAGIIGMNAGETKEVAVNFPSEYGNEELAGKSAVFTITLKELKEKELPELDDDFAQEISEFETLAALRESLEKRFKEDQERVNAGNKEKALLKALAAAVEVEIPETMIGREVEYLMNQQAMQLRNYGIDINQFFSKENIPGIRDRMRPQAVERLKQSLALKQVIQQESITVDDAEIVAEERKALSQLRGKDIDRDRLREVVTDDLLKGKTLKWLEENNTIELVPEGTLEPDEDDDDYEEDEEDVVETNVVETNVVETSASDATVSVEAEAVVEEG